MNGRSRRYYQMLGVVFLAVSALFFAATIGKYQKVFQPVVPVILKVDHIGTQMSVGADVKARGVLVGEVRQIELADDHARMRLALKPGKVDKLPANVSARLLPKTLFGQRYVALQIPAATRGQLQAGDVIGEDRSKTAIEIEEVLGDVMPILRAVQPQKIATTLNAISTALQGRGEQLGDTLVQLDAYLEKFNPSLPDLTKVVKRIDDVADTYADAAPDTLQALSDIATTTRTIYQQRKQISSMLSTLTRTSVNLTRFLEVNKQNMIRLVDTSRATAQLLARYAPEYPCMLKQFAKSIESARKTFGKGQKFEHIQRVTLVMAESKHKKYVPGRDDPEYNDQRGPRCYDWVEPPKTFPQFPPGGPLKDGTKDPEYEPGDNEIPDGDAISQVPASTVAQSGKAAPTLANSPAEQDLLSVLLAPSMGMSPDQVPDWSSLLVGPLFRGARVIA